MYQPTTQRPQAAPARPQTGYGPAQSSQRPAAPEGTVQIRGRSYTTVAKRVEMAHAAGGFSMVRAEVLELGSTSRLFYRVTIAIGERQFIGSAEVPLSGKPGTPEGDSPLEVAETSALGRALGFAGFASAEAIASADEMRRTAGA